MSESIVVFSHLRWDFVYQRPQHLLSRLARNRRVIFFQEPVLSEEPQAFLDIARPHANLVICTPRTPIATPGFHDQQLPYLNPLLQKVLGDEAVSDYIAWFYTPMALPLIKDLPPRAIVYDCMDELSAFKNAPRQLLQRETALLKAADIVFTGGPSLYEAKKDRHANVHCFASSVEAGHFAQDRAGGDEPGMQAQLPRPRLGFFGVLDERLDLDLLDALALAHPEWQIVMVGPVVKIDPASLPRQPNIHYFGQQSYQDLPKFIGGWDVCLLPFALNAATRYISPTKTLEYMAAERPIVSTPIVDVAAPYGDIVYIAESRERFIEQCERALSATPDERETRFRKMREVLARTSWDATAAAVAALLENLHGHQPEPAAAALLSKATRPAESDDALQQQRLTPMKTDASKSSPVVVIGAGPTGLSAAYHLGSEALLLEKNATVGGWCRSIEDGGFTFDYAGHIMFSNDPYVHQMYQMLLGDNVHWQEREAWVYSKNVYTRYPFQGALYGLPPEVARECIVGAIEARFGSIAPVSAGKTEKIMDCCGDGLLEAEAPLGKYRSAGNDRRKSPRNFEDFIYRVWGAGIARHFAIPYNRKIWAHPLQDMETSWLGGRVPLPDLGEMIEGALRPVAKPMGPNARFGYPLRGGFQALMNGFLPHLKGELKLNTAVAGVSPAQRCVILADGSSHSYRALISTMPLPQLIRMTGNEAPAEVRAAAQALRHVPVRCVNLGIGRENITEKHWIYYPEETVFHRIFVQGNASPLCNPPGGFGLTCEITYSEHKPLPCDGDALIESCIADCVKVGIIRGDDAIVVRNQVDMPYAYVLYDHGRAKNVAVIRAWLAAHDILLAGRYSEWEYYNSDHAFLAGKKAAEQVSAQTMREQQATA
ncbi:MAG: NAD(P)-binding protein [Burkholderiales bacterium]